MNNKNNYNRKKTRQLKKKGIALAIAMVMALSTLPVGMTYVSAATSSASYMDQADNTITFTDTGITVSSSKGVEVDGTSLKITSSGTYVITGSCSNGSVTVKKGTTNVTLVINNLSLASDSGAPIAINKENTDTKIVIRGNNTLTDNENPEDEDSSDEAVADAYDGAAIKLKGGGSLIITGDGTLNINGNAKNGIKGGDGSTVTIGETTTDTFTLNVNAANDGISSNGAEGVAGLNIIGGNINVSAKDDGIKSDYIVNIGQQDASNGATINVTDSYEGIEGATVNLYAGTAKVVSSDDGINAANSDLSGYSYSLNIYGGNWDIDAGGDGLDSNGTILISGGVTDISSSTQNDNNAIDWGDNSSITVTGGTIIGVGMGGMQQGFTNGKYVMFGANLTKGNTISIKDESGNTLYTTTVKKNANSVIFSDTSLQDGGSYTLYVNGTKAATATEGVSQGGIGPNGMQPGGGMRPGQDEIKPGQDGRVPQDNSIDTNGTDPSNSNIQAQMGAIYRMYNPNTGEHFYTENVSEARSLQSAGWGYENVAFMGSRPQEGIPVYRLYNPNAGDHHYTTNISEAETLSSLGWNNEGIGFFTESSTQEPVYRLYNPNAISGAHHYTSDYSEYLSLIAAGWRGEDVAWYTR